MRRRSDLRKMFLFYSLNSGFRATAADVAQISVPSEELFEKKSKKKL